MLPVIRYIRYKIGAQDLLIVSQLRGFPNYELGLLKYAKRGFTIIDQVYKTYLPCNIFFSDHLPVYFRLTVTPTIEVPQDNLIGSYYPILRE